MVEKKPANPPRTPEDRAITAMHLDYWDALIVGWLARNGIGLMRISLGIVFFWFGAQKLFPGVSAAEQLAGKTIFKLTLGHLEPATSLPVLATWECAIGLGLLSGLFPRVILLLLFGQMMGTLLPLFFFPAETWARFPYAPSLEGQYIIKNMVLVTAAMVVGATVRGGRLVPDPKAAKVAEKTEKDNDRLRRKINREP